MDNKMKYHYHVLSGIHGCMPDYNETYETLSDAREGLKWIVSQNRDGGLRYSGSKKSGYFECLNENYYAEISDPCYEEECLDNEY